MKRILAPHKEQQGWVYVRVRKALVKMIFVGGAALYNDDAPGARVISSRRVEEAVETADYLQRCVDEGLDVRCWSAVTKFDDYPNEDHSGTGRWWIVWQPAHKKAMPNGSPTLREAYWRHKNGVSS